MAKAPKIPENDSLPADENTEYAALANSANKAPVVPLAGVPETPLSNVTTAGLGPAVPSTDHYTSEGSVNVETSSPAPQAPEVTRVAAGEEK